jgi:RNA polymerase sigma-70 factor, ECF subfamily
MNPDTYTEMTVRLASLLLLIRNNDNAAAEELCDLLTRGITLLIKRRAGAQDVDDQVQEVLLQVLIAIKADRVRCPEAVAAYARGVALRKTATHIGARIQERSRTAENAEDLDPPESRADACPERTYLNNEQVAIARRALSCLQMREREVLRRFYVDEESPTDICLKMRLTATQFRLLKSRAKSRFADCGKSLMKARQSHAVVAAYGSIRDRCA